MDISLFEAGMLLCFGISWPISVAKSIRTKVVAGKSPIFMAIVALGYVSGTIHKMTYAMDAVIILYIINLLLVLTDLCLYFKYLPFQQDKVIAGR